MCGIIGVITKNNFGFSNTDLTIFEELLWADAIRGYHSTGIFGITNQGNVHWAKETKTPEKLLAANEYLDINKTMFRSGKIFIGHNRKATIGTITDDNAHPFVEDNIILVHNGTITNKVMLSGNKDVDSHGICHSFATDGHIETLKIIKGAYALAWYDTKTEHLYLTRNKERPLNFLELDNCWIIASESAMGEWIANRNGKKVLHNFWINPETIISFNLKNTSKYKIESETKVENTKVLTITPNKKEPNKKKEKQTLLPRGGLLNSFRNKNPKEWKTPWKLFPKVEDFFKNHTVIDFIPTNIYFFDAKQKEAESHDGMLLGAWLFNPEVIVKYFFNLKDLDTLDFTESDYFSCYPDQVYLWNGTITIKTTIAWAAEYNITHNGEQISQEYFDHYLSTTCVVCGTIQDKEKIKNIEEVSWKLKGNKQRFVCSECVTKSLSRIKNAVETKHLPSPI